MSVILDPSSHGKFFIETRDYALMCDELICVYHISNFSFIFERFYYLGGTQEEVLNIAISNDNLVQNSPTSTLIYVTGRQNFNIILFVLRPRCIIYLLFLICSQED